MYIKLCYKKEIEWTTSFYEIMEQPFSISVYVIPEDGPCGPKHAVKIIRHVPK
jgi:hypothetical protein